MHNKGAIGQVAVGGKNGRKRDHPRNVKGREKQIGEPGILRIFKKEGKDLDLGVKGGG